MQQKDWVEQQKREKEDKKKVESEEEQYVFFGCGEGSGSGRKFKKGLCEANSWYYSDERNARRWVRGKTQRNAQGYPARKPATGNLTAQNNMHSQKIG